MSNHVLRLSTLASAMLAATAAMAAPKPFDLDLLNEVNLPTDEEVVMHSIVSCAAGQRVCLEQPLDLNGDSRVDLVIGVNQDGEGAHKRYYAGRGDGLFLPPQLFGVVTTTSGIKFADLDGDGDLDMVESVRGNGTDGTNSVYVNRNGTLTSLFEDEQSLDSARHDRSSSVAIGDVNGDGKLDVIISNETTGGHDVTAANQSNFLYINTTGSANNVSFGPRIDLDAGATKYYTRRLALIDVEGDGDLDIVATAATTSADDAGVGNLLYVNTGASGSPFATAVPLNADANDNLDVANAIAVGDIDGDGDPDLVFSTWSRGPSAATNRYYLNNSTPGNINFEVTNTFGIAQNHTNVRLADLNNDSRLDLVAIAREGTNHVYLNTGNPAAPFNAGLPLTTPSGLVANHSRGVDTGDLNGDGSLDLIIANRNQIGLRYLNNDQCTGTACGGYTGPFDNAGPSITGQSTALIPPGTDPFNVNSVLGAFTVTDPDNVFPTDFTAVVEQPNPRYTCTDGVVDSGDISGTCRNGRITPTSVNQNPIIFGLKVRDGEDVSGSFTGTLTVGTGNVPTFTTTTLPAATEDAAYTTNVVATDADGNSLTYDSVNLLPSWLQISPTGTLSSVTPPKQGDVGTLNLTLRATDSSGLSAQQAFTLTVNNVNDKPVVTTTTLPKGTQGQGYPSSTVTATDEDPGTTLTFAASGLPAGLNIASATGAITGTPTASGTFPVDLTASDGTASSDPVRVSLTIDPAAGPPPPPANRAPTFTAPGPQSGTVGTAYNLSLAGSAADADGDTLSFAATGLPPGITLSAAGALSGSPTTATGSPFTVNVTVSDGKGGQATGSFQFTVSNPTSGNNNAGGGDSGGGGGSLGLFEVLSLLGLGALAGRRRRLGRGVYGRR
jgi:hypothetical protein